MKLKIVLVLLIACISTSAKANCESVSDSLTQDTLCLDVKTVEHLAKSTELYYLCDSLNKINEEEILLLRQVIQEKQTQENLHQGVLSGLRNEVTRLKRQRTFLSVGLGASVVALVIVMF